MTKASSVSFLLAIAIVAALLNMSVAFAQTETAKLDGAPSPAVTPKGATAFGVRLLERLVADNYEN